MGGGDSVVKMFDQMKFGGQSIQRVFDLPDLNQTGRNGIVIRYGVYIFRYLFVDNVLVLHSYNLFPFVFEHIILLVFFKTHILGIGSAGGSLFLTKWNNYLFILRLPCDSRFNGSKKKDGR